MTKFSFVSILLLTGAGAAAVACSSTTSDSTTTTGGSGGNGGTAHVGGSSGSAGKGGSSGSAGAGGEGGAPVVTTLYSRLGEHAGIAQALHAVVTEELKDPNIGTYFSQQASSAHKPTRADIEECLTNLLGKSAGGPEKYPLTLTDGYVCRDMATAHATLGIGAGTFDKFVMIAGAELAVLQVAADDIATIASVLNGTRSSIVLPGAASGLGPCTLPASCALPVLGEGGATGMAGAAGAAP